MRRHRRTSWKVAVAVAVALTVLPGCTIPSRNGSGLGGLSALNPPNMTQQGIEAAQPLPPQYAASREVPGPRAAAGGSTQIHYGLAVSSDDGAVGGVTVEHQAAPRQRPPLDPRGARPYPPVEDTEFNRRQAARDAQQDGEDNTWDEASTRSTEAAARIAYFPAKAPATMIAGQSPGQWPASYRNESSAIIVRGQSPSFGGQLVQTLPQRTPGANQGLPDAVSLPQAGTAATGTPPPGGAQFVQAGYGVNPQYAVPNGQYQPQPGVAPQPITTLQPPGPAGLPVQPATMLPFPPPPLAAPDQAADLDVITNETQTGRLMVGVGINSDAGLVGNLVIDEQNFDLFRPSFRWSDWVNGTAFRGAGQRFRVEAMPGTEVQRYSFNFQDPYFLDLPISFGVSAFYFQRNYTDWDEQRAGGRLSLGYLFPERPDLSLSASIGAESVEISNPSTTTVPQLNEVVGNNDLYTARVTLAHDTRDSSFLPTEGHFISLAYEQGFGTFSFPRFEADFRNYWWMRERPDGSGRHILGASAKVGVSGGDTPIFEHFFAGGFSTLRGFAFRGASPQQNGVIVGGEFQLLTSLEYRFPLTANDMLFGSFFVDAGTVEPDANIYARDFRVTPGFELRISVPAMGPIPIAVGIGVPIAHAEGDDIQNFHFFVGLAR